MINNFLNSPYTPRKPISRNAFAVRHMILEEVKFRIFETPISNDNEEKQLLERLALGLFVETSSSGYHIMWDRVVVVQVEKEELYLFTRGDTPKYIDQQRKSHLFIEEKTDAVLEKNNQEVTKLIDLLIEYLRKNNIAK